MALAQGACLLLSVFVEAVLGARFLFGPPSMSPSHKQALLPMADALAAKGHDVLVWEVMMEPSKYAPATARQDSRLANATLPAAMAGGLDDPALQWFLWEAEFNKPFEESFAAFMATYACEHYLASEPEHFRRLADTPWDVFVFDELFNPCSYALASLLRQRHGTKIALYCSNTRLTPSIAAFNGAPLNTAFNPPFGAYQAPSDRMGFAERIHSTLLTSARIIIQNIGYYVQNWRLKSLLPSDFGYQKDGLVSPELVLSAYLQAVQFPVAQPLNVVPIGGIHLPQDLAADLQLPEEWEGRIAQYPGGFVLVGVGHLARWASAPKATVDAFVEGFRKLPKDLLVIFQCKDEAFPKHRLPQNVHVAGWLPQRALLADPRIKLFLSHGGANSVAEAMVLGVPLLVFALFADQPDAAAYVEAFGNGRHLSKFRITPDILSAAVLHIIKDPSYKQRASKLKDMLGPEPQRAALKMGVFALKRLTREPGKLAVRARSPVASYGLLAALQYHSLDILAPVTLVAAALLYLALQGASLLLRGK